MTTTTYPASTAQTDLITRLLGEKDLTGTPFEGHAVAPEGLTGGKDGSASAAITALFALPRKQTMESTRQAVSAGRYAVEHEGTLKFYKVDRPTEGKWAGYTFVKVQASDDLYPVRGKAANDVLALIAVDPKAAMLRYGREIGSCGHCGRTLTDDDSRAAGIGPVCAAKI